MAAALATGLAGTAKASAITTAAPQAIGAAHIGAYPMAGGELDLGIQLFVAGVLLITAACFAWLVYLMLTCPEEQEPPAADNLADSAVSTLLQLLPGAAPPLGAGAGAGLDRSLGQLLRGWLGAWIGSRLGHPGPM